MGSWGAGLYANDTAADLRSTVAAVVRLPLGPEALLDMLAEQQPSLVDPTSEEYATCWFVVADRFHRYGIDHGPTTELVHQLVADGVDDRINRALGMSEADLRRRAKVTNELSRRLQTTHPKPVGRRLLKSPQELLATSGTVLSFPMMRGRSANPYFPSWEAEPFAADSYGAAVIVESGHVFGYIAYYVAMMLNVAWPDTPPLGDCLTAPPLRPRVGTLSRVHYRRMAMDAVDVVVLGEPIRSMLPPHSKVVTAACSDTSVSNVLRLAQWDSEILAYTALRELVV